MEPAKCNFSDIIITPDHLNFETQGGASYNPPTQDLFIKKDGAGLSASWDAEVTTQGPQSWLKLSPISGSAPKRMRVYCKSMGMPAGEWAGGIRIVSHVKVTPSVIPVNLKVKGEAPPSPPPEPRYSLTMVASPKEGGAVVNMTGDPPYLEGAKVSIKAKPNEGYEFNGWVASSGIFDDAMTPDTVFTMPAEDVTVTGNFRSVPPPPPPPPPPEKSWLQKFIEWLLGLFGRK